MTKNKALIVSIGALALSFLVDFLYKNDLGISGDVFDLVLPTLFLFALPLCIFSLLTYKMRDEVFRSWLHFAYWWVPISIMLTLLAGGGSGGGFGMPNVLDQEFFAFMFAALFTIISLIIIARKYFATRHK